MDLLSVLDPPPLYQASSCAAGAAGETGCTVCLDSCPFQAIRMQQRPEGTTVSIDPGLCRRCGACTGVCPTSSLERSFQPDQEIYDLVATGVATATAPAPVVVFGCRQATWNLADTLTADSVFVELRSLLVINETHLLQALRAGAGGVVVFGCPACHHEAAHLLEDSLQLVRSVVGDGNAVTYIEDDLGDASRGRVRQFILERAGTTVLDPLSGDVEGNRRTVLRQLLGNSVWQTDPHEPVAARTFAEVQVDTSACFMCGACNRACPTEALGYDPTTGILDFSHLDCVNCGLCASACPAEAVDLTAGLGSGSEIVERRVLVEDDVVACAGCGDPYLPRKLVDYSKATVESWNLDLPMATKQIDLCGACRSIEWDRSAHGGRPGVGVPLVDRREFLKGMGVGTAGAAMLALSGSPASAAEPAGDISPKRLAMVIDMDRCIGCHACTAVCKAENHVPLGVYRDWVEEHVLGSYPNARPVFLPKLCNHCDDPGCMRACPTGAIFRRADGIVDINHDICIGCRACNQACPYACTFMDPVRGTADKCNFCSHRIDQGLNPACVDVCPTGCRIFGDLDDPDSPPSIYLRDHDPTVLRQELGLGPNVKYVGLPGILNR